MAQHLVLDAIVTGARQLSFTTLFQHSSITKGAWQERGGRGCCIALGPRHAGEAILSFLLMLLISRPLTTKLLAVNLEVCDLRIVLD